MLCKISGSSSKVGTIVTTKVSKAEIGLGKEFALPSFESSFGSSSGTAAMGKPFSILRKIVR